jgi:hypothetical protein
MVLLGAIAAALGVIGLKLRYQYARMHVFYAYNLKPDDPRGDKTRRFFVRWVTVSAWIMIVIGAATLAVGIATGDWIG